MPLKPQSRAIVWIVEPVGRLTPGRIIDGCAGECDCHGKFKCTKFTGGPGSGLKWKTS